jgi:uncharacterized protein
MIKFALLRLLPLLAFAPAWAWAQDYDFHPPQSVDEPATAAALRDLTERLLPVYQDTDIERYLSNLAVLQLADSNYAAADDALQSLRQRRQGSGGPDGPAAAMGLYVHAMTLAATGKETLAQAFAETFRDTVPQLDDRVAYAAEAWLAQPPALARDALQQAFDNARGNNSVDQEQALALMRDYAAWNAQRSLGPLVGALAAEEQQRRYLGGDEVLLHGAGGAQIHVRVVRPKGGAPKRPALLEFDLDPSRQDAVACAAHGYVGVVAYSEAGGKHHDRELLFKHEGEDARTVIRWIAKQPWSDGRVGMYGDGFGGFAAWSAARRLPGPLKAIATWDAMAPGIDFPAPGRVFHNAALPWAIAATAPDGRSGRTPAQWAELNRQWYRSGKPYRALDRLGKARDRNFDTWLAHPSYDRFWQRMVPFGRRFATVGIPVLSMTGYYSEDEAGALYYFAEHQHYRQNADTTLLIGPWDDDALRHGVAPMLRGYGVDAAARVDLWQLRLQWFDHVFRNTAAPTLLSDRVNYEQMGANEWRHAPTLAAAANDTLKLYLAPAAGERQHLAAAAPKDDAAIAQTVSLKDRRDADWTEATRLTGRPPDARNGLVFVSDPLPQGLELDGSLSGTLDFDVDRMDLDLRLALYELPPSGGSLQLGQPYTFRASYAGDRVHRRLLKDGERQALAFHAEGMIARKLQPGSRLLLLLEVNKRPDEQINYGTGSEVSGESIADARRPLRIRWYGDSVIELPVRGKASTGPK